MKKNEIGLGNFITKNLSNDPSRVTNRIIAEVNKYAKMMDDSKLSYKEEKEIRELCILNPKMMDLICSVFYNKGYDSF